MANFPPSREGDLITSSGNFDTKITATPVVFGLSVPQAASFHTLQAAFVAAHTVANDPLSRSHANIVAKNAAKDALIANYRLLAGIVQRFPGTTNFMRAELGLPLRNLPSPIPPPAGAPLIAVLSAVGRTARIRLIDVANPTRRAKPAGVSGASVFSFIGAAAPADLADWTFEGNSGRTTLGVAFPSSVPAGATAWFCAFWFNPRKQAGPNSAPVSTNLPGGSVSLAA